MRGAGRRPRRTVGEVPLEGPLFLDDVFLADAMHWW